MCALRGRGIIQIPLLLDFVVPVAGAIVLQDVYGSHTTFHSSSVLIPLSKLAPIFMRVLGSAA